TDTPTTGLHTRSLHDALPISRERRTRISKPAPRADVRMRGFPSRMDVDEAVRLVRELVRPLDSEPVGLDDVVGRVLAMDIVAPRSEEHTSELHHEWISYAVFC